MSTAHDKVVLVTGGSGGLGRALGEAFAREGATVVLASRDRSRLEAVACEIARCGGRAEGLACDVTRRDQVERLRDEIRHRWGAVQVLINNAGIARAASFLDMGDELWEDILRVNLTGAYLCCKIFLPDMIAARWGRVINIASTTAKVAYSHASAYTSSKHGLLGLTRALALETARLGVTVNAICPGYLDDDLTRDNARRMAEETGQSVETVLRLFAETGPQKRLISPAEVAALAVLLASEAMAGVTGQAINVDGGAVMV